MLDDVDLATMKRFFFVCISVSPKTLGHNSWVFMVILDEFQSALSRFEKLMAILCATQSREDKVCKCNESGKAVLF